MKAEERAAEQNRVREQVRQHGSAGTLLRFICRPASPSEPCNRACKHACMRTTGQSPLLLPLPLRSTPMLHFVTLYCFHRCSTCCTYTSLHCTAFTAAVHAALTLRYIVLLSPLQYMLHLQFLALYCFHRCSTMRPTAGGGRRRPATSAGWRSWRGPPASPTGGDPPRPGCLLACYGSCLLVRAWRPQPADSNINAPIET